ncbi:MAG TPA: Rieske 2Fe-2S domain-containing protein [Pyrinomonadaceae bacterium]
MDSENNPSPPTASDPNAPGAGTETSGSGDASPASTATTPVTPAANDASANTKAVNTPPGDDPTKQVPAATPVAARVAPATGASKTASTPTPSINKGVAKSVAAKQPGSVVQSTTEASVNKIRRRIVWASIAGFLGTSFLMFLRFFLPRSIFEPSNIVRVGAPGDYGIGVDTKWQQQYRIWVVKTSDRLFVINAVCTHLGCTPDWKSSENKFKCPCHGSGYDSEGVNFEGPAPRPMDRAHVELDAEGQIVVNKGKVYTWPKGEKNQFNDEGAYIPL